MQATVATQANVIGIPFVSQTTVTTDGLVAKNPTLGPAKTGTLTTRTDANTGVLTMTASHGITDGVRLDVYWSGGRRYGMTVGTVATNSVPIDLGAGDDLPLVNTAVTAMVAVAESFPVTAAAMGALFVGCGAAAANAVFVDGSAVTVVAVLLDGPTDAYVWFTGSGATTPFGSNVANVYLTQSDSSTAWPVNAVACVN
jgi:hypothetical protein